MLMKASKVGCCFFYICALSVLRKPLKQAFIHLTEQKAVGSERVSENDEERRKKSEFESQLEAS